MTPQWMDFPLIRLQANFVTVLASYGIALSRQQGQVTVLCPFHSDHTPSLSINLDNNMFHCFACQAGGDILDFVARIENVRLVQAAERVAKVCGVVLDGTKSLSNRPPDRSRRSNKTQIKRCQNDNMEDQGNPVKSSPLDITHPYLFDRGLSSELIKEFGLGVCSKGRLRNRVCIPIHSPDGSRVLGSSGRWANNVVPKGIPKYLLPAGFRKSQLLFNYHRAAEASHLVIVEGYWSVFRLHALKVPAVALMGSSLSDMQARLLFQSKARWVILLLDADPAGQKATADLLPLLSSKFFVHTPVLPDGASPDDMAEDLLVEAVRS